MSRRLALSFGIALALWGCTDRTLVAPRPPLLGRGPGLAPSVPEPGRYLVGFDSTADIPADVLAASGGKIIDSIPAFNVLVLDEVTNPDALRAASPKYIEAGFDIAVTPILSDDPVPSESDVEAVPGAETTPWYASKVQWDMRAMKADEAWAITDGGAGTTICIVDTGIDDQHQELVGKVALRANFVANETRIDDPNGHGSHVAGEAAAKGIVVNGVAPRATLLGARVLNANGSGTETAITNGIRWCADNGAHVINLSLGGIRYRGTSSYISSPITYGNAIAYATNLGVVMVVSSGNSNLLTPNPAQLTVPAEVAGVISVGATGPLSRAPAALPPNWDPFDPNQVWQGPDTKAFYSNYGPGVQVFAPGGRGAVPLSSVFRFVNGVTQGSAFDAIWSVCSGNSTNAGSVNVGGVPSGSASCLGQTNRYWAINGTSMAAPHVSGAAAVVYAELGGVRSPANRARVEGCIRSTTDAIGDPSIYGGGRVNVRKAVEAIRNGSC